MRRYVSTQLATDWELPDWKTRVLERFLFFIPKANPNYEHRLHLVCRWLIEFESGRPCREVGIGPDDSVVLAGPTGADYGFWLDTNMEYDDFEGEEISEQIFERYWTASESFRSNVA